MNNIVVKIKKLPHAEDLPLPQAQSHLAAGVDLLAAVESDVILSPLEFVLIPTGIAIALPVGYEAQVRPRSGLAAKHGITILNAPGTVDADYRGEIKVALINFGKEPFAIKRGMRIAQLVIAKTVRPQWQETDELPPTERGSNGFGSTGF